MEKFEEIGSSKLPYKMDSKRLRKRLLKLWEEDPKCCWCGILTRVEPRTNGGQLPNDTATLEHLYSRLHPKRRDPNYSSEQRRFLACHWCNHRRGIVEDFLLKNRNGYTIHINEFRKFNMEYLYDRKLHTTVSVRTTTAS